MSRLDAIEALLRALHGYPGAGSLSYSAALGEATAALVMGGSVLVDTVGARVTAKAVDATGHDALLDALLRKLRADAEKHHSALTAALAATTEVAS